MVNGKGDRLRELLHDDEPLELPGGFSPMMAKMVQEVGFDSFFMAGSHTGQYIWGLPDAGLLTMPEMVGHARRVADGCDIPVLADADTGYGNAVNVYRTVRDYARTGVAGITIEDQDEPKKGVGAHHCISPDEAVGKYRAAAAARDDVGSDLVIFARCDFITADDGDFDGAVERCIRYVKEGGADAVWLTQVPTREQFAEACERIPAPVMPGYAGPRPAPTRAEKKEMGAAAILYRALTTEVGMQATWQFLHDFKERGEEVEREWAERAESSKWGTVRTDKLLRLNRQKVGELESDYLPHD